MCVGVVHVDGVGEMSVVRNTGSAGSASEAAAVSLVRDAQTGLNTGITLHLEPRKSNRTRSRNGARVYLANRCIEGTYSSRDYAHLHLLNRTLSFTVDLSVPVACGCSNSAGPRTLVYHRACSDCRPTFASLLRKTPPSTWASSTPTTSQAIATATTIATRRLYAGSSASSMI